MKIFELNAKNYALPLHLVAKQCPELEPYLNPISNEIDLGNSIALATYNTCLFKILDGLDIEIPNGHLIPTAGIRRAVVDVILQECQPKRMIEVGTGTTAIISQLLALRNVEMIATEIDPKSIIVAKKNILKNQHKLKNSIIVLQSHGGILSWMKEYHKDIFPVDGVVCFPPYYDEGSKAPDTKRGYQGTNIELFSTQKGNSFAIKLLNQAESMFPLIKNVILLWKHEQTGIEYFKNNQNPRRKDKLYRIKSGTRTRLLSVSSFSI